MKMAVNWEIFWEYISETFWRPWVLTLIKITWSYYCTLWFVQAQEVFWFISCDLVLEYNIVLSALSMNITTHRVICCLYVGLFQYLAGFHARIILLQFVGVSRTRISLNFSALYVLYLFTFFGLLCKMIFFPVYHFIQYSFQLMVFQFIYCVCTGRAQFF